MDVRIPASESWKCVRCGTVLPSRGEGKPPIECLSALGGCGRTTELCEHDSDDPQESCELCAKGYTRFFPEDWGEAKVTLYIDAELDAAQHLFRDIVLEIERLVEFQKPSDSRVCALYVFQSYLFGNIYPAVFYIAFESGLYGTGKTTATRIVTGLCREGIMAGGLTPSAVERYLDRGRTLGVDEIDALPQDIKSVVEKALRHGYERGAISVKSEQDAKGKWEPKTFNIFSPKAFNFRDKVDEALVSRTAVIQMARVREEDMVNRVGDNLVYLIDPARAVLLERIRTVTTERLKDWSMERVRKLFEAATFRQRVHLLAGDGATPREVQLSYIALLTAEIVGVDIVEEWRATMGSTSDYAEDNEIDDLRRDVTSHFEKVGRPEHILSSDLRAAVNYLRSERKDPLIQPKAWPEMLAKLGLRRGSELKRVPGEGNPAVYFTEHALKCLHPVPSQSGLFRFTETSQPAGFREVREVTDFTDVKSQEEGVKLLRGLCEKCSNVREDRSFTVDEIVKSPGSPPRDVVERWFKRWAESGELFEMSYGRYKLV